MKRNVPVIPCVKIKPRHYFQLISTKARIVFNVELEGSARKLVTVRSALQVVNKLSYNVDLKMEKSLSYYGCKYRFPFQASAREFH